MNDARPRRRGSQSISRRKSITGFWGAPQKYRCNVTTCENLLRGLILIIAMGNIVQIFRLDLDDFLRNSKHQTDKHQKGKTVFSNTNDVVTFDHEVMANIKATYNGAHSYLEWAPSSLHDGKYLGELQQFQAIPLSATVDRRPIVVRKQLVDDESNISDGGKLLGCAISSTTFLSNIQSQYLKYYKQQKRYQDYAPTCDVCFQFSNREDMTNFVPGEGYEPLEAGQTSTATKCFQGEAQYKARFAEWQQTDERFEGFGYPWTVDCVLKNGIKELTCREISKLEQEIEERDDVQRIYYKSNIAMEGWFGEENNEEHQKFHVHSSWPWSALMSHDDDRWKIARTLSQSFDDANSPFVPQSAKDMKLMHVEGPGYDQTTFEDSLSLKSMTSDSESRGGLHFRLVSNLFHLIRNAPGSTHMIAVVDGQARQSYMNLLKLLNTKLSDLYPIYGRVFQEQPIVGLQSMNLIPISKMTDSRNNLRYDNDLTLMELMRHRQVKIHMVPIVTPSLAFEKTVCGVQYQFATYLAARYAADYHVIMFIDGDTAMMEQSQTLQSVLYDRFFSENSSKCAGHRLRLIEQYVKPEENR